ncbi:MAG: GNAT family N-acetyltransferase [Nevskiales bacterium]|nr:GNAT family N-acetyltransferase [Nevskiales bacterium]
MQILIDDLSSPAVAAFLEAHLQDMRSVSPPESRHALDIDGLRHPSVSFWCMRDAGEVIGCGALQLIAAGHAEIKSMRVATDRRRQGIGAALLRHLLDEARRRQLSRVSLETGSMPFFESARRLYAGFGFAPCPPFGEYRDDPNSVFMTLSL